MSVKEMFYSALLFAVCYGSLVGIDNGIGLFTAPLGALISIFILLKITPKE